MSGRWRQKEPAGWGAGSDESEGRRMIRQRLSLSRLQPTFLKEEVPV